MEILKHVQWVDWKTKVIDITYDVTKETLETALDRICQEADEAAQVSCLFTLLSDLCLHIFANCFCSIFYRPNINSLF